MRLKREDEKREKKRRSPLVQRGLTTINRQRKWHSSGTEIKGYLYQCSAINDVVGKALKGSG